MYYSEEKKYSSEYYHEDKYNPMDLLWLYIYERESSWGI